MSKIKAWELICLFSVFCFLSGCSSKEEQLQQSITQATQNAEQELNELKNALALGQIRNANLLKEYSRVLQSQRPDLAQISALIGQDATSKGPLFQGLAQRLEEIKSLPSTPPNVQTLQLLDVLRDAMKPSLFGDALTDPINMLADMSNGTLARVGAISKNAEGEGEGNQLVGNPNYGQWQTNSSGISFWQWYGMYRILGDVFDAVEYGRWSKRRKYSYYNDYGRYRYSSPKQIKTQTALETRTRQSYQRQGKQFTSPYAKKRSGASGLSRSSYTPTSTRSSYAKSSSYSKRSAGSVRNSSSRTSRGVSRGK
ncbi:hypothetical protein PSECIP111951_02779 [Pseudoalteromonas holothuriae]|uniref:CHAD domain-containing protein n=1 Tax=Pseudoalteromonas holothuriae TaxID=2963714 RepID=A0A9W4W2Y4_9GAMM|nr:MULTISPECIES: CHAD domain-containing protein [unclassified Pseudoalteromonas]CAH9055318.1 hypothetical protein PSECIP111854_01557 [Pseudoalteromonas sp. CIP111854]CAH9062827.1 hypothetical protein PSECIP111951_02779 [Pseudoalteromonas sp. CIP111951]